MRMGWGIDMTLKINGTDITQWVVMNGVKWSSNDIDGPDAGRTLDATMWRNRVASKVKLEVTCTPMDKDSLRQLLNLLSPEYVTVDYYDPMASTVLTKSMYTSTRQASFMYRIGAAEMWEGITFSLIER